ncbi:DUF1684 domain-containing protein [Nocardia sp. BMG51109]|uniref:DUF1684 domain-containing protein n=1 Tax=Nocardia sp. BMG51109 TaxID=1056816 RepID=UPI00056CA892|nr:DUF1684 domain-containing protein [Nocardia sp. BMG51109]
MTNNQEAAVAPNRNEEQFAREWRAWRAGWEQFVSRPFGWLSAVSIDWVDPAPQEFPGLPGRWWQQGTELYVDPQGATMSYDGESFSTVRGLDLSATPDDVRISAAGIEIGVTCRDRYLLVGYRSETPARAGFDGVPTYAPDPRWAVTATFEPTASAQSLTLESVGTDSHTYRSPGVLRFTHDGGEYTLLVTGSDNGMYAVFADATSGVTTYGAGRSLAIPEPDADGTVLLDFNRATNLPCAFSDYFPICPMAPADNRLPFAVEAGEKIPHEHAK